MSDYKFLSEFSTQPAKPPENVLTPLSGSYEDAAVRTPPAPVATPSVTTKQPVETYSKPDVIEEEPEAPKAEPETIVIEPEVNKVTADKQQTQKFSYGVVGDVPPGFKAAASCCNCKHSNFDVCSAFNFPINFNYTCDSFEIIKVETEVFSNVIEEPKVEAPPEPELTSLEKAVQDYDSVLSTFADGDVAHEALNKVVERFTNRSEYADAFLKLRYRRFYEDKHGNLQDAFVSPETTED
jgi:hypothetical protein